MNIESLFEQAVKHRDTHDCSAYPYEEGHKLIDAVERYRPERILEIGTGMGYTAAIMAQAAPQAGIISIEKDPVHIEVAKQFLETNNVLDRVNLVQEPAEQFLPNLNPPFDFVFFDGYQIHYEMLPHYERLLKSNGILFLANNHLRSRTSDRFFEELNDPTKWEIIDKFKDTTIAQRW